MAPSTPSPPITLPHEPALKDVEFDKAPFGILGFETALGLTLEQLVHTEKSP